ncbi:MAG TPA: 50S ribosomal protein L32 [Planctomycetota bacterium]|nr:50S ribosomal protein L32 [Planctomycetota bacterium]
MANPKRRHSNTRSDKRRTHDSLTRPVLVVCDHCNNPKAKHAVCLICGYYNGKQVIKLQLDARQ